VDLQDVIRAAAFAYVDDLSDHGRVSVTRSQLNGFRFEGRQMYLVGPQGIFKPAGLDLPISILTVYRAPGEKRPYDDEIHENDYLLYRYRGTDRNHHQNVWLRQVRDQSITLLYFEGVAEGRYLPSAAAIIEDRPEALTFGVQLMPIDATAIGAVNAFDLDPATRRHYLAIVQQRIGQARFRESVLDAYSSRCTLCRLRHRELLDAALIVSYAKGGTHQITNGMSMCKIHHAAYDLDIVGVRPDGVAEVRTDILEEMDGPMLRHGLQEVHGVQIHLPRAPAKRPSVEGLERRYERFRERV
jgi:putative restriction endonuclease